MEKNIGYDESNLLRLGGHGVYKKLLVPLHYHEQIELVYVETGSLDMRICNHEFHLEKNDFAIIKALDVHCFNQPNKGNVFICHILPDVFTKDISLRQIYSKIVHDKNLEILKCLNLYSEFNKFENVNKTIFYHMIKGLILSFYSNLNEKDTSYEMINDFIQTNFTAQISLNDVAKACNTNSSYVSKLVNKHNKMTFKSYLNTLRLNEFLNLVINQNTSINDAIWTSGFNSSRSFYRAFYRAYNTTPKKYIKSINKIFDQ